MGHEVDTIYALSTGAPPSGVAVIRVSGPQSRCVLQSLADTVPPARTAVHRSIRTRNGDKIDSGLLLFFPGPHSFTGEDSAELHLHGSRAVIAAAFDAISAVPGCRPALPGEFTRRAFENGKLDLVEAEGLADLLAAETEMQRRLALEQSSGHLSALYDSWTERLLRNRALIEAELDFADEEDVPGSVSDQVWKDVGHLAEEIRDHLARAQTGEIIRDGFKIVIAGRPNAGKSSLFNALAQREAAIVTSRAGTTRDVLELSLNIGGYLVRLFDTAGLRETEDEVEREGIRRATLALKDADLVLLLDEDAADSDRLDGLTDEKVIRIATKSDLYPDREVGGWIPVSTTSGSGLKELETCLADRLTSSMPVANLMPGRARQKAALETCLGHLDHARKLRLSLDLRSEELRLAQDALAMVTGRKDVEDMLDVIFSEFCIGK